MVNGFLGQPPFSSTCHGLSSLGVHIHPNPSSTLIGDWQRPPHWNGVEGMDLLTWQNSLGGSGIQGPFVSRGHRGCPRKNCTSLMKYNSIGMAAKLVKKSLCV
eukprot:Gb_30528 [translate_table: standard]